MENQSRSDILNSTYQGILFVDGEVLGGANGEDDSIINASLDGQGIAITWRRGRRTTVSWDKLKEQAPPRLPRPRLVFVHGSRDIGLYFASDAPVASLQVRKPNSLIGSLGWLTSRGFSHSL